MNVTHWWGIENQFFGGDPMTLPFLRFLKKQMCVTLVVPLGIEGSHERDIHLFFGKMKKRQSHRITAKNLILNAPPMGDVHTKNQRPVSKNGLVRAGLRLKSVKNAVFRPFLTHHRLRWPRMMLKRPPFFGKFDSDRFPFFGHLSSSSGSRDTNPCPLLY